MKAWIAVLLVAASSSAIAVEKGVRFDVMLKRNGEVIESSSGSGALGAPVKVSLKNGMFVDAVAGPPESDGRSKTQVRINIFHRDDTDMTFEFVTRADIEKGSPSFDYQLPQSDLKFRIEVVRLD